MSDGVKEPLKGHDRPDKNVWITGFWRRFPWTGLLSLLAAVIACAFMLYIVTSSDGQPINSWRYQPTVYLSITYTIANIALQYALAQAITMTWWIKALKGARVRELHNVWAFGSGFTNIIASPRSFNLVALAGLAVTLVPINGPLLQRSSEVTERVYVELKNLTVPIALEVPFGYTGGITGRGPKIPSSISSAFSDILKQYNVGQLVNITNSNCDGVCRGKLLGAGYDIRCRNESLPQRIEYNATAAGQGQVFDVTPYVSNVTYDIKEQAIINFTATFKTEDSCDADWTISRCTLQPATIEYPVIFTNDTITLDAAGSWRTDRVHAYRPLTYNETEMVRGSSTHGGLYVYIEALYKSSYWTAYDGVTGWRGGPSGPTVQRYSNNVIEMNSYDPQNACKVTFFDPTTDAMDTIREIAFRTALYISQANRKEQAPQSLLKNTTSTQWNETYMQQIEVEQTTKRIVFGSQKTFLAIAVSMTLLTTLCIFFISLGWWHLGREVSLSPIETAKAFSAPALQNANSNAKTNAILEELGNDKICYGTAWDDGGSRDADVATLRFDRAGKCEKPRNGQLIG